MATPSAIPHHSVGNRLRSGGRSRSAEHAPTFETEAVNGQQVYRRGHYRASQLNVLLARYVRIRGDLLLEWGTVQTAPATPAHNVAIVCAQFLEAARRELESRKASLPVVANLLGMSERALVDLYRPKILKLRLQTVADDLARMKPPPTDRIEQLRSIADGFSERKPTGDDEDGDEFEDVKTALKDAVSYIHGCYERQLMEDDLQVSRLNRVFWYLIAGFVFLLLAVPVISTFQTQDGSIVWPVLQIGRGQAIDLMAGALGLSVAGAVGGIVSGMLTVRDSPATLDDYRTSLKKLALKPVVGAVAALILYLFLSASVVSGVEVTSAGTYVVAAFAAGFSERYFLRVLNAQIEAPEASERLRTDT